jgi:hypothetical protein
VGPASRSIRHASLVDASRDATTLRWPRIGSDASMDERPLALRNWLPEASPELLLARTYRNLEGRSCGDCMVSYIQTING